MIQILELLGDYSVAVERLQMYAEAVIIAERPIMMQTNAQAAGCQLLLLYDGISRLYPKKKLLQSGLSGLMDIDTLVVRVCIVAGNATI
ncbi:MAG: hypothetical protein ACLU4J_16455 [Butyricimonas paravirosa]